MGFSATFTYTLKDDYSAKLRVISKITKDFRDLFTGADKDASAFFSTIKRGVEDIAKLAAKTEQTKEKTKEAAATTKIWRDNLKQWGTIAQETGTRLSKLSTSMANLRVGAAGFMAQWGLRSIFEGGLGYERIMNRIQAATLATNEEMAVFRKRIADISTDSKVFSKTEVASVIDVLARTGMSTDKIFATTPKILSLSRGSGDPLDKTTNILKMAMTAFEIPFKDIDKVVDTIALTSVRTPALLSSLESSLQKIAPIAKGAGWDFYETMAVIGTMSRKELKDARAGTMLMNLMRELLNPQQDAIKILMKKGYRKSDILNEKGLFKDPIGLLESMQQKGFNPGEIFKVANIRGGQAAFNLLTEDQIAFLKELLQSYTEMSGVVGTMENIMGKGLPGSVDKATAAWENMKIAILQAIEPIFTFFLWLKKTVAQLTEIIPWLDTFVGVFLVLSVVVLGAITTFGILAASMGAVMLASGNLTIALAGVGTTAVAAGAVGTVSFGAMAASIGVVALVAVKIVAILAGLAVIVALIVKGWQDMKYWTGLCMAVLKQMGAVFKEDIQHPMESFLNNWKYLIHPIESFKDKIMGGEIVTDYVLGVPNTLSTTGMDPANVGKNIADPNAVDPNVVEHVVSVTIDNNTGYKVEASQPDGGDPAFNVRGRKRSGYTGS
jgi:TP901 family phage tail tape measure protein